MKITSYIKKITWAILPVIIVSGFISFRKASGGHPGTTRAPGEPSCSYSGCHNGPALTGEAMSSFYFSDPDTTYMPGQTYTIELTMTKSGIDKFGFEMVALQDSNEVNTGSFLITDSVNTHQIYGWINGEQRWYMTHTLDGSVPATTGTTTWTFDWTAPNFNAGDITFYYGMNCANNDGTPNGDEIYTHSFKIYPAAGADVNEIMLNEDLHLWYNKNDNTLNLEFTMKKRASVEMEFSDLTGKIIFREKKIYGKGKQTDVIKIPQTSTEGVYFINLNIDQKQKISKKIIC